MKYEKSCGAIIYNDEKPRKYLIVKSVNDYWSFPKGHVEEEESEKATAIREVREETGLDIIIKEEKTIKDRYFIPQTNSTKDVVYFFAKLPSDKIKLQEVELIDYAICNVDEALKLIKRESTARILVEADNYLSRKY